jgi:ribosome-binding ATPase
VAHLVRLFDDPEVAHVTGAADPARDIGIIETELALADLESLERQAEKLEPKARSGDKKAAASLALLEKLRAALAAGKPASSLGLPAAQVREFSLLSAKPALLVGNCDEKPAPEAAARFEEAARAQGAQSLMVSAKLEAEIAQLPEEERAPFLAELGARGSGLERFIVAAYRLLGLRTFFTVGDVQVQGWTVPAGAKAPQAAGRIHSDFERGFIRAEVYAFEDIDRHGCEAELKAKGLIRSEGKDYVVKDGDVCFFKFSS